MHLRIHAPRAELGIFPLWHTRFLSAHLCLPCIYLSVSLNVSNFPCLDYCKSPLIRLWDASLCSPTHLPCCQVINPTKLPTYLFFQLSRWLLQREVVLLSLAHKSAQNLLLLISPTPSLPAWPAAVQSHQTPQAPHTLVSWEPSHLLLPG